ncbi:hypothetical protein SDC9_196473 [bioreactor metagenome]|uniref:Uncharacterized protein n=1 Tax=bioreactor metagenome TaxID=1076179 RepID=A0A645IBY2_9ZZZZ
MALRAAVLPETEAEKLTLPEPPVTGTVTAPLEEPPPPPESGVTGAVPMTILVAPLLLIVIPTNFAASAVTPAGRIEVTV